MSALDPHHEQLIDIAVAAAPEVTAKQATVFLQLLTNLPEPAMRRLDTPGEDRRAA